MFLISLLFLTVFGHELIYTAGKEKFVRQFDSTFSSNEIPAFLKKDYPYYTVELVYENQRLKKTVKTCLLQNGFNEQIEIFTDPFYFNYITSGECGYSGDSFNSTAKIRKPSLVPRPPLFEPTEKQEKKQEEQSFWSKYWYYIVPLLVLFLIPAAEEEKK
ncbi:hypothetical protein HDV04_004263 [Boothiomyces sp. JEL0838]|nr:hypothetical protein HDV04_004263 [Boothiomyces sp. JEL0838]